MSWYEDFCYAQVSGELLNSSNQLHTTQFSSFHKPYQEPISSLLSKTQCLRENTFKPKRSEIELELC